MMEHTSKRKALLGLLVLPFLLPLVSSEPLSRTPTLTNRHGSTAGLEVPAQGVVGAADQGRNLGEVAARMDIEVNDYPGSGANNRHEPRSPGRG